MDIQAHDGSGLLRVFTVPAQPVVCTDDYDCECLPCRVARSKLTAKGSGPAAFRVQLRRAA